MNELTANSCIGEYKRPSVMERLKERELRASNELKEVQVAIAALNKNPEFAEVIEAVNKVIY